jgi:hypothetical protein
VELAVKVLLRVGDHGEGDVEFLLERRAFRRRSHAHQNDMGTGLFEGFLPEAQLRDLLAAERSAEMSEKYQHQP